MEHVFENIDLSVLNTKTIESLIKVGAFDQFADRSAMLEKIDDFIVFLQLLLPNLICNNL